MGERCAEMFNFFKPIFAVKVVNSNTLPQVSKRGVP